MVEINSNSTQAISSKHQENLEYCDTDIFILIRINNAQNIDFEKLTDFFNTLLDSASNTELNKLTNFFNRILKRKFEEKTFDFSKATLRYYNNNHIVVHTRVLGPPRNCDKRVCDQTMASEVALEGIKQIIENFEFDGEILKQIWIFYTTNLIELKSVINKIEPSCEYREICLLNKKDYCVSLFLGKNVILGTQLIRNVAEGALNGIAYTIIEDLMNSQNEPQFIFDHVNRYFQKGTIFRASAEKPFSLYFWISLLIFTIFSIYIFFNAFFAEGDMLFKSGIAFIGISSTIGLCLLWMRYGKHSIIR